MILDTSYLVALQEGAPGAVRLARDHESNGVPQRIPTTVLSELYVSVGAGSDANENVRKYEELIGNLPVVDIDENVARRAGALRGASLTSDSDPVLGLADATVAAAGLVFNEPVVTGDADDFGSIPGLDIVHWDD